MSTQRQELNSAGEPDAIGAAPRFVLLRHETPPATQPPSHWDFLVERGSVLWSWRLRQLPSDSAAVIAERIQDHRIHYLNYTGPLSGERGEVTRIDQGILHVRVWTEREIRGALHGALGRGELHLVRLESDNRWSLEIIPKRWSESVSSS